jgi:hypothetical protein
MAGRFCTTLDCVDVGFLPEDTLDQLPLPSRIGATRIGGIDLNKPRIRSTLAAVLALATAPGGFTVTDLATKVHTMTGQTTYTTRQAAYDLRKLRGKDLIVKPGAPPRFRTDGPIRSVRDCKINGVTPETGEAPVTVVAMDVSAESGDGLDEQLVRQLAARARAEGLKLTGEGGGDHGVAPDDRANMYCAFVA